MRLKKGNLLNSVLIIYFYFITDILIFGILGDYFVYMVLAVQMFIMVLAMSSFGELVFRTLYGSKEIITNEQKKYLEPIFMSVYMNILDKKPLMSKQIKLYIDNSMTVNAYALGNNTITVTRGAIEMMTSDQLKGIIAHEFGHLYNGDTITMLVLLGGNIYIVLTFFLTKLIKIILGACDMVTGSDKMYGNIGQIILWVLGMLASPFILFTHFVFEARKRKNEYMADKFAYDVGYGNHLISALYKLSKINLGGSKMSIIERLKASHPDIENRIERLEYFTDNQNNSDG